MMTDIRSIIKRHVTTERTTNLRATNNEYVFEVDRKANKNTIRHAVENAFKVKVVSVRTQMVPGKRRRMGRFAGTTPMWKKAIVKLQSGNTIAMFEA